MPRPVLVVVHQEQSTPGRVGEMLTERGHALDRRCPNMGDTLPSELDGYAAMVVFGGPMSANDDYLQGILAELRWLERHALSSGVPLLGICLGAQQIARVLGARVGPHDDGLVEIGYSHIHPTDEGREFLAEPAWFYQWHAETFEIPPGARHLAGSESFPSQAFQWGERVWGIEFHPEMTRDMIERWCTSEGGAPKLGLPGAQPHHQQIADYERHGEYSDRWLAWFLDQRLLAGNGER